MSTPLRAGRRRRRWLAVAPVALLLAGCSGASDLEACVQHSVDEGLSRGVAEQACRDAGRTG